MQCLTSLYLISLVMVDIPSISTRILGLFLISTKTPLDGASRLSASAIALAALDDDDDDDDAAAAGDTAGADDDAAADDTDANVSNAVNFLEDGTLLLSVLEWDTFLFLPFVFPFPFSFAFAFPLLYGL